MKVSKTELLKALEMVKPGLANKEMIEQSTSFAFINGRVVTYNDDISLSHPVVGLELEGAVEAKELYGFLSKSSKDEVDIAIDGNELKLKVGKAKVGLKFQAEVTLPLSEDVASIGKWQKLPIQFLDFLSLAMTSCGKDMSRPLLTCVHINKKIIEASDSYQIMHCIMDAETPVAPFLLRQSSAQQVCSLKPTKIADGKGWIHFKTAEGTILSCRVFEGVYADTAKFIEHNGQEILFPEAFVKLLERASIFAKRDHLLDEVLIITIEENKLTMKSSSETGWFEESCVMKHSGDSVEFNVSPYLLRDILKHSNKCFIKAFRLAFKGEGWIYIAMLKKI